jgi:signal transduction histidine kinase
MGSRMPMGDIRDVVLPEDRLKLKQALEVSARSMKAWREEFRARHPKRGQIWVELHAMPVREPDGAVAWHGFLHEITARKQVEEEIRRVNAELEARVAERTEELQARHREMEAFTYSVSHDLKAPLRGIDGYSRLLLTDHADRLDDEGRLFVETIRRATVHMGRLIDDLLTYSRVERSRPTLGRIDPAAVIRQLVSERQRELAEGGVQLKLQLDCQAATGEREGLAMVVRNLLDNAIKFTVGREPRRIEIDCREEGGRCRICVADNGPGFDMRYHDRIFEIFQRLHRAEDYPGTGVGLAIVRKAVERMHGRAWAESVPQQGARFFVELPL